MAKNEIREICAGVQLSSCQSPLGEFCLVLCSGEDAIGPIACKDLAIGAEQREPNGLSESDLLHGAENMDSS